MIETHPGGYEGRKDDRMITPKQVEALMDGCALLECLGNLYEYVATENGKLVFQSISNDRFIKADEEALLTMLEYHIQH